MNYITLLVDSRVVRRFSFLQEAYVHLATSEGNEIKFRNDAGSQQLPLADGEQLYTLTPALSVWVAISVLFISSITICGFLLFAIESQYYSDSSDIFWRVVLSGWLAFTSVTSIGYGDIYPQTSAGRFLVLIASAVGFIFPVLVTWLSLSQEECLADYDPETVFLPGQRDYHVRFRSKSWPSTNQLKATLLRELLFRKFLGRHSMCVAGTYREITQLRSKLWYRALAKPVVLAGALAHSGQSRFGRFGEAKGNFESFRVRDRLYLVQKRPFFNVLKIVAGFLCAIGTLIIISGMGYFFIEADANPDITEGLYAGMGDGVYLSAISMLTVGFGEIAPVTLIGKIWTVMTWLIFQLIFPWYLQSTHEKQSVLLINKAMNEKPDALCSVASIAQLRAMQEQSIAIVPGTEADQIRGRLSSVERLQYQFCLLPGIICAADLYRLPD